MSAIALKWVSETRVGNQAAKHVLLFLASHNFQGNQNFFSIRTLSNQLELSEKGVRNALEFLVETNLLIKEHRYKKDGGQLTNNYALNIPDEYVENYYNSHITPP